MTSTALPRTPVTNTGLRPTRSESIAQNGIVQMATRLATIASQSMKVSLNPMLEVVGRGEVEGEDREHGVDHGDEGGEEDAQDVAPVVAEEHAERAPWTPRRCCLLGLELGGLVELAPDDEADQDHDGAEQNGIRQPQASSCVLGQHRGERQEHRGREHLAALGAAEGEAGEEAAPVVGRVLEGHRVRAGLLTGGGEALEQAQEHEQGRRQQPTWPYVGRQPTRKVETPISSSVPIMTVLRPSRSPMWPIRKEPIGPGDVRDAEGGERGDGGGGVVALGEEDLGKTSAAAVP